MVELTPYGIQREICRVGIPDESGSPVRHHLLQVASAIRIRGSFAVPVFIEALDQVVASLDVLRGRLRWDGARHLFVPCAFTGMRLRVVDLPRTEDDRPDAVRRYLARETVDHFDLQNGPLLDLVLVEISEREHYLTLRLDHSVSDGISLRIFLAELTRVVGRLCERRVARPDEGGPGSFLRHLAITQARAESTREEVRDYWRSVARAAGRPRFVSGQPKPWQDRSPRVNTTFYGDRSFAARVFELAVAAKSTPFWMLVGALSIALRPWCDAFPAFVYHRSGRGRRGESDIFGPLFETVLTVVPDVSGTALDWMAEFCELNQNSPSLNGDWLTEILGYDLMGEMRLLSVNMIPNDDRDFDFCGAVGSFEPLWFAPSERFPARNGIRTRMKFVGPERIEFFFDTDPDVIPGVAALYRSVVGVVDRLHERPDTRVEELIDNAREDWRESEDVR